MADALQVELVAADHKVWSGEANLVVARTADGDLGILRGHEPLLGILAEGPVTIHATDGSTVSAAVHGGFLSVAEDRVTVLAEVAELAADIDVARARAALERAAGDESAAPARRRAEVRLRVAAGE